MKFEWGDLSIFLPPLPVTIIAIVVILILVKWSKELETGRYKVFLYFFISTYITPIYQHSTEEGMFKLLFPFGFLLILIYMRNGKRNHPAKTKASILGFCIAIYQMISFYTGLGF
ncbi:hypothetical protein [Salimicrobium halophilum]|uniref:Uncharacterized protein n=1 Tax=Salimicrobium halophilum TaxID=86666 RepID=A0A1G8QWL3_9BACI|nr:hypothetical protein [Salimicrobium halophilum]SDJ09098.1 hypothetical protein SAMN04490247_0675 [Salimicrobium halophilum]